MQFDLSLKIEYFLCHNNFTYFLMMQMSFVYQSYHNKCTIFRQFYWVKCIENWTKLLYEILKINKPFWMNIKMSTIWLIDLLATYFILLVFFFFKLNIILDSWSPSTIYFQRNSTISTPINIQINFFFFTINPIYANHILMNKQTLVSPCMREQPKIITTGINRIKCVCNSLYVLWKCVFVAVVVFRFFFY